MDEPSVDELVVDAERRRALTAHLPTSIAGTTGTVTDPDGIVEVSASATGEVRALRLHASASSLGGSRLGDLIVRTARQAADVALQLCYNELAQVLGDTLTRELEEQMGPSPARAAGWDVVGDARLSPR